MAHGQNICTESSKLREEITEKQKENEELRKELQNTQHEFHDFKRRMGKVVDLTLGSSGFFSEDITNPCRESELKIMYEKLRINEWANLVPKLKKVGSGMSAKDLRMKAEQVIRDGLQQSQDDIQNIMNTLKGLTPSSQEHSSNTKTAQYFESTIQNLQLAIYHEKVGSYNTDKLQDIPDVLRPMIEECYKIGCLMALHNPPLLLDFDNCGQGPFPPVKTERSSTDEEMTDPTVFIAVDLGMDFSGYCFKIAESKQTRLPKWGEEFGFNTPKTPTCILFDEDQKFLKFGYDAVMTYTRLIKKDKAKKLYLFENFKMELPRNELNRDLMLTAKNGKQMRAMKVFSESLRFMKDHALEMIRKHTSGNEHSASEATWILTVPAIWSAAAKEFMREAATEAGLVKGSEPDRLIIALEHEAAIVWCKQLPSDGFMEEDLTEQEAIKDIPGTQYMVVDCGGVNITITVHEVMEGGHLKELNWLPKTFVGSRPVAKHFKEYLRKTFSEKMYDVFEHPSDLQKLIYDYNGDFKFLSNLEQLVRKVEDKGDGSRGSAETQSRILQIGDKLKLLHDKKIRIIASQIREILKDRKLNINYMFLVGGFALSPYVSSFVREKFGGRCKVLCPVDAQMAVLNGAVTFGMIPNVVKSRISRFTQKIAIMQVFDQTKHKGKPKYVFEEGVEYCEFSIHSLVKKNESVHFDDFKDYVFSPLGIDQGPRHFHFYYNDNGRVEFKQGMKKIGSLTYNVRNTNSSSPHLLKLKVKFVCTEMQATVRDVYSGETVSLPLDFMSK